MKCLNCGVELGTDGVDGLCSLCRPVRIVVPYNDYQKFRKHVENSEIKAPLKRGARNGETQALLAIFLYDLRNIFA